MHDITRKRICALLEKKERKKFTGRLLDRVNTLLDANEDVAQMFQFKHVKPWLHAPIFSSEMLSDVTGPSEVYKPSARKSSRAATL